ncbi:MAG TPA: endonuclease domain-containing protein [Gemmatimonadales bacterium]|nr:endonuclease domain-containing protein [Gemmatimonadales bacterium]
MKADYEANGGREKSRLKAREWRERHSDRDYYLRYTYGISAKQYHEMLEKQHKRCMVCQAVFQKRPRVDHEHGTRKIRGLLCLQCNSRLGWFETRRERILAYLAGLL